MKNYLKNLLPVAVAVLALLTSCDKKASDDRPYQATKVVAVKVDGVLYNTQNSEAGAVATLPAGQNLENVKLEVLTVNGDLVGFENGAKRDCRYPLDVKIAAYDGTIVDTKIIVVSPPKMISFIIEGVVLDEDKIFSSVDMVVVQVPKTTDLTALKVSMEFTNGTVQNFVNGQVKDYTAPVPFSILGVDGTTVYPYDLILTTEEVGPATVKGMKVNGIATDSVVVVVDAVKKTSTLIAYVKGLTDFSKATITDIELGYGNKANPANVYADLNLHTGANKIKVTGSNGIETEFTFGTAQVSAPAIFTLPYADIKLDGNGKPNIRGAAITGNYVVLAAQNPAQGAGLYYDLTTGEYAGTMNLGTGFLWGTQKVATDPNGVMLWQELGNTGAANALQTVYKFNDVTAAREVFLNFKNSDLNTGTTFFRAAGISIQGNLSGNATVIITQAGSKNAFVYTVTGGVLNTTPVKYEAPVTDNMSNYWSVQSMPDLKSGYVMAAISKSLNGLVSMTDTFGESFRLTGINTNSARTITHNNRTYMAYVAFAAGKGAIMRVCDITDGSKASFEKPIVDQLFVNKNAGPGNSCMEVDFKVINGKLHAMFMCENIGVKVFNLEQ